MLHRGLLSSCGPVSRRSCSPRHRHSAANRARESTDSRVGRRRPGRGQSAARSSVDSTPSGRLPRLDRRRRDAPRRASSSAWRRARAARPGRSSRPASSRCRLRVCSSRHRTRRGGDQIEVGDDAPQRRASSDGSSITTTQCTRSSLISAATRLERRVGGQLTSPQCIASATLSSGRRPSVIRSNARHAGRVDRGSRRRIGAPPKSGAAEQLRAARASQRLGFRTERTAALEGLGCAGKTPGGTCLSRPHSTVCASSSTRGSRSARSSRSTRSSSNSWRRRRSSPVRGTPRSASIDRTGHGLERFLTTGIDPETHAAIGDLPEGRGILGVLIREAEPLRLRRPRRRPSLGRLPGHTTRRCRASSAFRSFFAASRTGTCISPRRRAEASFTDEDEELTQLLAAQAAVAIENTRLYETSTRWLRHLESLNEIGDALAGELELEPLLGLVARRLREPHPRAARAHRAARAGPRGSPHRGRRRRRLGRVRPRREWSSSSAARRRAASCSADGASGSTQCSTTPRSISRQPAEWASGPLSTFRSSSGGGRSVSSSRTTSSAPRRASPTTTSDSPSRSRRARRPQSTCRSG